VSFLLVIFDLDGTLVDSFDDIRAGAIKAFADVGVSPGEEVLALCRRGLPLEELWAAANGPEVGFGAFAAAYRARYLPACTERTVPYPGARQALAEIGTRARVAIATTKRTETAERVLAGTGLRDLVHHVCGSDGLPAKPDPAVLRRASETAGVPLARALMVGDTDRDVLAARAGGATACAVTWGGFEESELRAFAPDHVVRSFDDLVALCAAE
jgi:phosphoglycolate phosphatase